MKEGEEKNIDRKFREGLTNPEDHIVYNDADWDAMDGLLNEHNKRRGNIIRMPFIWGAAAAIMLLALGLYFFWPEAGTGNNTVSVKRKPYDDSIASAKNTEQIQHKEEIARENVREKSLEGGKESDKVSEKQHQELISTEIYKSGRNTNIAVTLKKVHNSAIKSKSIGGKDSVGNENNNLAVISPLHVTSIISQRVTLAETDSTKIEALSQQMLAAVSKAQHVTIQKTDTPVRAFVVPDVKEKRKSSIEISGPKHPLVLSIVGAPDFNGVGSAFNRTQIGTNVGLLFSVGVTRKLFITTGAAYARKPYMVGMDKYQTSYQFSTQPNDVSADCRVLDIPLNIDYQVYNKGRNLFSIGTGLSTYFMLRENYHFNYNQSYVGPSDYNISNQNKHILGLVNLNANYQRRINSKFGFNVQPYMKLPITNIGYGQVNLKSTGVAVGASWYLNASATKN